MGEITMFIRGSINEFAVVYPGKFSPEDIWQGDKGRKKNRYKGQKKGDRVNHQEKPRW
jgi:hypothetical protein